MISAYIPRNWTAYRPICNLDDHAGDVVLSQSSALFAKSLAEMIQMVQMIEEELAAAGLHLNVSKTKLLTTDSNERVPQHVEIGNAWVEVLTDGDTHKY